MTIHDFNTLSPERRREELQRCCGSSAWVNKMFALFPVEDLVELLNDAEEKWYECNEADWKEAFTHHPKIGDMDSVQKKFGSTADWATGEQSLVSKASPETLEALTEGNRLYEEKFGYIFIVCATGRPAATILENLQSRLSNTAAREIQVAADEQNKITKLRLQKLFA